MTSKKELNFKLFGEERPKFVTTREKMIIDFCLRLINVKEKEIIKLNKREK